jgi:cell division protein FtsQ
MNKIYNQFLIGIVAILVIGWFGWQEVKAQDDNWLPVKYIRIEGAFQYISKEKIKRIIATKVTGDLYHVDMQKIQQLVKQLPWVNKVEVKRVWPDAISIRIKEHQPVVRWGGEALLNKSGQIFKPDNIKIFQQLPLLSGPAGHEQKLLSEMNKMIVALMDYGLILTELFVNERRAWSMTFDNEIEVKLGRNKPKQKFNRFLKTFALIGKEQIKKVAVVDLRYVNGYSLTWKRGEKKINWKQVAELNKT